MLLQQTAETEMLSSGMNDESIHRSASESCLTTSTCDTSSVEEEDSSSPSDIDDDDQDSLLLHPISEISTSEVETVSSTRTRTPTTEQPLQRTRKSSLRAFDVDSIPIRNRGWRNLPKLPLNSHHHNPHLATTTTTASTTEERRRPLKEVTFDNVAFRCFEQCAGDNPAVSIGTPIALDWDYVDMEPISLQAYESSRTGPPRTPRQLMMNYFQRRTLLSYRYGVSEAELQAAEQAANRIRNQRTVTRTLLPAALVEDCITSCARKTRRAWWGHKNRHDRTTYSTPITHKVDTSETPVEPLELQV